jgi:energy-coupling factor transporter ATP-binding protein EcfA2
MTRPGITAVWLDDFKSYKNQRLDLEPVSLLVGRNGSGKSNAIDALALLALLADERDIADVERGDMKVAGLRGGISGASPFGEGRVRLGCSVLTPEGGELVYRLELDASERPEIVSEQLELLRGRRSPLALVDSRRLAPGDGISEARTYTGGAPRAYQFLSSRLAITQVATKVPEDSKARRLVVASCAAVVAALKGVFILDPVPGAMREYVRIGSPPDRSGSTLSAIIHRLRDDEAAWSRLIELVRGLVEAEVIELTFSEGRLPGDRLVDVMVAVVERAGERTFTSPARLMSDGTLRYLPIVASLLDLGAGAVGAPGAPQMLVVEEIENGLFPSQASRVLDLLRAEARQHDVRLLATTHSPALLDAVRPEDHAGVVVCDRQPNGFSGLTRLIDLPRYVEIAGGGAVGQAITRGELAAGGARSKTLAELIA